MDREFNHNDYMDSVLAPVEAQRDDAWEELNKVKAENDALRESVKDLLDLTEYGDIDAMVWKLVNDGDEWVVERLNRAQRLVDNGGE